MKREAIMSRSIASVIAAVLCVTAASQGVPRQSFSADATSPERYDLVVVGVGSGGFGAALAAGRAGLWRSASPMAFPIGAFFPKG